MPDTIPSVLTVLCIRSSPSISNNYTVDLEYDDEDITYEEPTYNIAKPPSAKVLSKYDDDFEGY